MVELSGIPDNRRLRQQVDHLLSETEIKTDPGAMTRLALLMTPLLILASACGPQEAEEDPRPFMTGAEVLADENFESLAGQRVGLITNHTATVGEAHIADLLHETDRVDLVALYGPEHGIRGEAPAGEHIEDEVDEQTGLPVYSLYGETRRPTPEMLEGVDVLVFDIQDVGPRFYTYISTMGMAMEAAAEHDIRFVVLDRPNPLGGISVEGFIREEEFDSFVGYYPIAITHGLTIGELATMAQAEGMLEGAEDLDLSVVELRNWERTQNWNDLGREWNPPSPNIPNVETAMIYPGTCFFEGTTASEGRGTPEPFLFVGAPWADSELIAQTLNDYDLPGIRFEAAMHIPETIPLVASDPKHEGEEVHGVRHVITDERTLRPVETGIYVLHTFYHHAPEEEREEFLNERWLNLLSGTDRLYNMLVDGASPDEIVNSWTGELASYMQTRQQYLRY